jgi:glycosyltransferase involved in cell wall biosynthesis
VTIIQPAADRRVVCHFLERLDYGGAEALVHTLATSMSDSHYRPIVCCLQRGRVAVRLEQSGVTVHCLNLRRRSVFDPLFVFFLLKLTLALRKLIREEAVAIIQAHLPDPTIWASLVGAITGTPVVGTYHGLGIIPPGRGRLDPRNRLRRTLYRMAGRLTARTIAVSVPVRQKLCDELGFDPAKTVLIVNGVDTAAVARATPSARARTDLGLDDRAIICCVGRLIAGKGQRFLIDAMPRILERASTAALLLVGNGPERQAYEERVRQLNLSTRVRFAGERDDVANLLAMADVFVLPSFSEGIPLALIEAMAAGKPVVATAVPGNLDVVVDDRYGVLVPAGDEHALAEAIGRLLADPKRAAVIGANGQARVRTHFDVQRSVLATIQLYDEVLSTRPFPETSGS